MRDVIERLTAGLAREHFLQGGHALVADFGIALAASKVGGNRMTETGMSLGTPQYMSPEQAMHYALGSSQSNQRESMTVTFRQLAAEFNADQDTSYDGIAHGRTTRRMARALESIGWNSDDGSRAIYAAGFLDVIVDACVFGHGDMLTLRRDIADCLRWASTKTPDSANLETSWDEAAAKVIDHYATTKLE